MRPILSSHRRNDSHAELPQGFPRRGAASLARGRGVIGHDYPGFRCFAGKTAGAVAQSAQGEERQTGVALKVIDSHHAVVPNAEVVLADMKNKKNIRKKTDSTGLLRLAGLTGGSYKITVVVPGFKTYKNVVVIPEQQTASVEVTLQPHDQNVLVMGRMMSANIPVIPTESSTTTTLPPMPDAFRSPQLPSPMRGR